MSEEEKKAIEELEEFIEDDEIENISVFTAKKIKNIIDNQQKEIEELKNNELDYTTIYINGVYDGKKYYKDKIREKIKEYQEKAEDVKQKYKGVYAYKDDYLEALAKIEGYQELLKEK